MADTAHFSRRRLALPARAAARVYTPGPFFALCVLLVAVALVVRRGRASDAALVAATALIGLAVSQALSVFSYRYGIGLIVLLPFAAALALTALLSTRTGTALRAALPVRASRTVGSVMSLTLAPGSPAACVQPTPSRLPCP